jgi:uncharacterized protein
MIIAWGTALTLLIGIGVLLEISHEPEDSHLQSEPKQDQSNTVNKSLASVAIQKTTPDPASLTSQRFNNAKKDATDLEDSILPPPTFVVIQEDPDLIELGSGGLLPKRSADGKVAWQTYAHREVTDETRPRIAIIITDMGLNKQLTTSAIKKLPAAVAFAFSPYAVALNDWRSLARSTGHEVLMLVPMEPLNYPQNDPGSLSLITTKDSLENIDTLHKVMSSMVGYVGMMNQMGSKFMTLQPNLRPILTEMNIRGLMFVDGRTTPFSKGAKIAQGIGLPRSYIDTHIDRIPSEEEIMIQLQDLENRAKTLGVAVGLAHNYPLSITLLQKWIDGLSDQGFQLVPITATVNRQPIS